MKRVAIEFVGGPFDGQHFDSACPGQDGQAATELYQFFRVFREEARRQESMEPLGQVIRRASPSMMAKAYAEGWTEARRRAMMPYYDYALESWLEDETEVLIRVGYIGTDQ